MTVIWKPTLDDTAAKWQALADDLGRKRFGPLAEELDREQRYPWETIEALVENKFTGLFLPRDYGGEGQNLVTTVAAVETLGTHCASTAAIMCAYQLGAFPILLAGTDKQKDFYLREMTQGRATSFALSERIAHYPKDQRPKDSAGLATESIVETEELGGPFRRCQLRHHATRC